MCPSGLQKRSGRECLFGKWGSEAGGPCQSHELRGRGSGGLSQELQASGVGLLGGRWSGTEVV